MVGSARPWTRQKFIHVGFALISCNVRMINFQTGIKYLFIYLFNWRWNILINKYYTYKIICKMWITRGIFIYGIWKIKQRLVQSHVQLNWKSDVYRNTFKIFLLYYRTTYTLLQNIISFSTDHPWLIRGNRTTLDEKIIFPLSFINHSPETALFGRGHFPNISQVTNC